MGCCEWDGSDVFGRGEGGEGKEQASLKLRLKDFFEEIDLVNI